MSVGLVLEGGGMRGSYTAGVLSAFEDNDVYFPSIYGISAGACNAVDYVSRQPGRTRDCMIPTDRSNSYYFGIRKFIKEKSLMDMDMVFDRYPNEIYPFDYDTYFASDIECEIVTTNCVTGRAEYMTEDSDKQRLMKICRASCSMPLICPMVNVDGIPYLDGGLADSIPIERAMEIGNGKSIVILTRNPGYRKKMPSRATVQLYRRAYKKYPNLIRSIVNRSIVYNRTMKLLEQQEAEGKIFVLRPLIPTVSRLEKDYDALMHFYEHGYRLMRKQYDELMRFLEK